MIIFFKIQAYFLLDFQSVILILFLDVVDSIHSTVVTALNLYLAQLGLLFPLCFFLIEAQKIFSQFYCLIFFVVSVLLLLIQISLMHLFDMLIIDFSLLHLFLINFLLIHFHFINGGYYFFLQVGSVEQILLL